MRKGTSHHRNPTSHFYQIVCSSHSLPSHLHSQMRGKGGGGKGGKGEEGEVGFHIQKSLLSPSTTNHTHIYN